MNTKRDYTTYDLMAEIIKVKETCATIEEMLELHKTHNHEDVIVRMRGMSVNMICDEDEFVSGLILEELSDFYNDRLNNYLRILNDMLEDEIWGVCDCDCEDCVEFEDDDSLSFLDEDTDFDNVIPEPTDYIKDYESV